MTENTNPKRPRIATILAALALMIALGGTATAASGLINGKKIKNNTITGKKIKNKTITKKKLAPATVKALKGQTGPQGAPGKNGVVVPVYESFNSTNLPANTELAIGSVNLPAGKYLITANVKVFSIGTAVVGCHLSANNGGGDSESSTWSSPVASSRTTIPVQMVTVTDEVTQITLGCHPGAANGSASGTLTAIPVQ